MIRNVRNLKDHQQILSDTDLLFDLGCSIIIEDKFSTGMVFQVVREGILSIVNNIIMAEQVVTLEIVGCEDAVEGVCEIWQLSELSVEVLLEKLDSWFLVQLIGLEEAKEVALLLEELQFAVDLLQLLVFLFGEEVRNWIMKIWSGKFLGHASTLYNIYGLAYYLLMMSVQYL